MYINHNINKKNQDAKKEKEEEKDKSRIGFKDFIALFIAMNQVIFPIVITRLLGFVIVGYIFIWLMRLV
ncbi:hypothetical protein PRVXT_000316 [Proteinivorax tanatarense]|uniref:Uncharacterized protein n=1 Tax=Proteinivorax tanatarense TaxID=1260629 RepID=A0AAU7VMZ5_9FIRM